MKERLQKLKREAGFTLAELLIVVAIIAVLTAIAIPIFTTQLERSKEATDAANIRSAYAEIMAEAITNDTADASTKVTLKQGIDGWQNKMEFPANLSGTSTQPTKGQEVTITYTAPTGSGEGTCAIDIALAPAE